MRYRKFGVNEFSSYLRNYHQQEVNVEEVGYESVLLEHDEVDPDLIPDKIKDILPNPTLYNTYIYSNEKEWMVAVAVEAITYRPLFLVCTQNGEIVNNHLFTKDQRKKV